MRKGMGREGRKWEWGGGNWRRGKCVSSDFKLL